MIVEDFQSRGGARNIDDLDVIRPIHSTFELGHDPELSEQFFALLVELPLVLLPVGVRHCMIEKGLDQIGVEIFVGSIKELEIVPECERDR